MGFRISPWWWPVVTAASPVLAPKLALRQRQYKKNLALAEELNAKRLGRARPLDLPELAFVDLTVLVEWEAEPGFRGDSGVSYYFKTDQGSLLFDVGFGPANSNLAHNAARLGLSLADADALAISHLHLDHMGGFRAQRSRRVGLPEALGPPDGQACYLPDQAGADGFSAEVVTGPRLLAGGMATTGPLARSLTFMGLCQEQALVARIKDKGLVVFTGCGHPTLELILEMVRHLSDEPLYAVGGGLHLPVKAGRGGPPGIHVQTIFGTGKPFWCRIGDTDVSRTIAILNKAAPSRVLLSAHDTCDYALSRLRLELKAETEVLKAGAAYHL